MTAKRRLDKPKSQFHAAADGDPCPACRYGEPPPPGQQPAVRHIQHWRPAETPEPPALPRCPACGREPEIVAEVQEVIVTTRQEAVGGPAPATDGPAPDLARPDEPPAPRRL